MKELPLPLPAELFRPLELLVELLAAGRVPRPLGAEDLRLRRPADDAWGLPLQLLGAATEACSSAESNNEDLTGSDSGGDASSGGTGPGESGQREKQQQQHSAPPGGPPRPALSAAALLQSRSWWCFVHQYSGAFIWRELGGEGLLHPFGWSC